MGLSARVSLPGYDALSDTNLDHFSLYADVDNVLIKRLLRDRQSVAIGNTATLNHGLGYIPFFISYTPTSLVTGSGEWTIVTNEYNPFQLPNYRLWSDSSNVYLQNNGVSPNVDIATDIFYDDMTNSVSPSIVESKEVIKFARPGKEALTTTNPNDYIMHSDLNNFKILKEANTTVSVSVGDNVITIPHGASLTQPIKYFLFVKFPDGKSLMVTGGPATQFSYDGTYSSIISSADSTNIYLLLTAPGGGATTLNVKYIIYGTGVDGTIAPGEHVLAISAAGKEILTETNPENFNYHSDFNTLKYFQQGSATLSGTLNPSSTLVSTIAHNLGYHPFFIIFVQDFAAGGNNYALTPYEFNNSTFATPNNVIYINAFADGTNIYLQATGTAGISSQSISIPFYYKIFKNNLGL